MDTTWKELEKSYNEENSKLKRVLRKRMLSYIKILNKRRLSKITKGKKSLIKEILGSKMHFDIDMDDGLSRYLVIKDIREDYITETMISELHKGDIVVDIGANVGYYALLEAKIVGYKGKVYAIEPVPESVELLRENVQLNKYSNIEIDQMAIGDKTGVASMYVGNWLNRSQMKDLDIYKQELLEHEISTVISTLDDFLENKPFPNIIRMDVEGYEYNVIKGMKRILEKKRPLSLFMEFHFRLLGIDKCQELLRMLKTTGFEITEATYEKDEKCITHNNFIENIASYLNSKCRNIPFPGHLKISIDDILSNAVIWKNKEGALDLCLRLGTLEILFKRR
ncbi:hypothetical protein D1BOALGB6SA_9372 [Olavius sp. associated proteobacterium Delta 1]|nr:hypothetical protein D1BOALGB6SA_9372 [Olavius sp. associated proteobacterium Delta 1]